MVYNLTLVAKERGTLNSESFAEIQSVLEENNIQVVSQPQWLSPEKAAFIQINQAPSHDFFAQQWEALEKLQIDIFMRAANHPAIKVLFMDMDKTTVDNETLDDVAAFLGVTDEFEAITNAGMGGNMPFGESLSKRTKMLADYTAQEALDDARDKLKIYPGVRTLIAFMKAEQGTYCGLTSGGLTYFTDYVRDETGFDVAYGSELEIKNGLFTGNVVTINGPEEKQQQFLKAVTEHCGENPTGSLAMGDGDNDSQMLMEAGLAFGHRPKPALAKKLYNVIRHTDHVSVLYALGHNDKQIQPYLEKDLRKATLSQPHLAQG